jgi:hypothetical protein
VETNEYKENEKVVYKTIGKLSLQHKKPEEVGCLVTQEHVVIEAEQPIKIPLSRIKHCDTAMGSISVSYSTLPQEPLSGTATLTFLDDFDEGPRNTTSGELLGPIRDKTRDNMYADLRRLGIDARMVQRGRVEEEIRGKGSLGIIHIPEGAIRWVNIRKETYHSGGGGSQKYYYTEYGVPDARLESASPPPYIHSIRKKTFPLFGKVVDVLWKGKDYGTGVVSRLNSEYQLKEPIMKNQDVTIQGIGEYGCWIISTCREATPFKRRTTLSAELWKG